MKPARKLETSGMNRDLSQEDARNCKQPYEAISQPTFYEHNQVQHSSHPFVILYSARQSSIGLDSQKNVSCVPMYVLGTSR